MKDAIDSFLPLERNLFYALNGSEHQIIDNIMWTISGRFVWIPLFLFIVFVFFYKAPLKQAITVTIFFILVFVAADQVSSSLFKPMFERFRPTHHPDFMDTVDILNGYRGGRFGFISGHATNSFGLATFLSLSFLYRRVTFVVLFWAALNSYTRIYLGVHFISDIIAGMLVGIIIGLVLFLIYNGVRKKFLISEKESNKLLHNKEKANLFSSVLLIYILALIILSPILATLPH